jgi:hypothetical protein
MEPQGPAIALRTTEGMDDAPAAAAAAADFNGAAAHSGQTQIEERVPACSSVDAGSFDAL